MKKNYSLGLDIGTNSVGWAVVDENNDIVKKGKFAMWGVRMFDEASDAKERRSYRESRRRTQRRKERINLLKSIFENEINKVDSHFFERVDDSFFKLEDKRNLNHYNLFNDKLYTDKDFYRNYPTIYHLRKEMMEKDKKFDIRMLYLVMSNMIKYRGNFLYPGDSFTKQDSNQMKEWFETINDCLINLKDLFEEDYENYFSLVDYSDLDFFSKMEEILISNKGIRDKKLELNELFNQDKSKTIINELFIPLLVGSSVKINTLYPVKDFKYEKCEISTQSEVFEDQLKDAKSKVSEFEILFDVLPVFKEIVDHFYLVKLLGSSNSISESMVKIYDKHEEDLKALKELIKKYIPEKFDDVFRKVEEKHNNYARYVGFNRIKDFERFSHCSRVDFYTYIKSVLSLIKDEEAKPIIEDIYQKIDNSNYLLRQNSDKNGSLPMQLNLSEMKIILEKQSKYYPFLLEKDEELTNIDRIISIFKYKIPYYVGPLCTKSTFSWVVRENEKIYPWNFDKIVNKDESAKKFIERMQNKCTYLKGENDYCLPKKSLLFSEYNCLSYLNKLKINGKLISVEQKNKIFKDIFLNPNRPKPTKKDIVKYLVSNFGLDENINIPELNCDMSSYITFKSIFKDKFSENIEKIEDIIKDITIFEDRFVLEKRLKDLYNLDDATVKKVKGLNYKGYGRLSKNLLNGIRSKDYKTGEMGETIIQIMRNSNMNLQELLFDERYNFSRVINEYNIKALGDLSDENFEDFIEKHVYVSPVMKRPMIQAYKIIEEVERILGQPIDKYYIECTRGKEDEKDKIKNSRYDQLKGLYKNCNQIANEFNINMKTLNKQLDDCKDKLRSDKLYLYFTQLGRSMYSLKPINFDELTSNYLYDIDHIYPQSLIKDDSISNRVLTEKEINNRKSNKFLFELDEIKTNRSQLNAFYKKLYELELIRKAKYDRLTKVEFTNEELNGFVNRQIVVTNQAVRSLVDVLRLYKGIDNSRIIYARAENVSDFRRDYDLPKSRTANNFHHAHDAYLNVVIGRVIHDYYTRNYFTNYNDYLRLKEKGITVNPKVILRNKQYNNDICVWNVEEEISKLNHNLYERFDIHETVLTTTSKSLYSKVTILPASKGANAIPVKTNDERLQDTSKYGGITSYSYSKYAIVEVTNKGKKEYVLKPIPTAFVNRIDEYLRTIYDDYKVINDDIRTNVIIKQEKKRYIITGVTGNQYRITNNIDRYFEKGHIKTIKAIEKYESNDLLKIEMQKYTDKIIISPAKNEYTNEVSLSDSELTSLYDQIKKMFGKDIYSFSNISNIHNNMPENIKNFDICKKVKICSELLKLLKTNNMSTADLTLFGLAKASGMLLIPSKLDEKSKIISTSITGYYEKVLFEVKGEL